nr:unnamed protein product [Spirometra erinaceieuropaei]
MVRATGNGAISEAFAATNAMNLMFSAMLMDAHRGECPGVRIAYGAGRYLLNSRRMPAPPHLFTATYHDLLFVDDCELNIATEENMQRSIDLFASGCANFGPTISTDKLWSRINSHRKLNTTSFVYMSTTPN